MAKMLNPAVQDMGLDIFSVPSLENLVDGDREEMVLCPVRAVKRYLSRTEPNLPACSSFLISLGRKKCVSKNDFWLQ